MAGRPPSEIDLRISARIRSARAKAGLRVVDCAAALGVTWQQFVKYETGQNRLTGAALQQLANLFGMPAGELFEPLPTGQVADTLKGDPRRLMLEARCEAFNAANPVGSAILVWFGGARDGRPVSAEVTDPARIERSCAEPRVRVRGFGSIALSRVFQEGVPGRREIVLNGRRIDLEDAELRVSPHVADALREAAAERQISATELINRLIEAVAADSLIDAVLDDGAQTRARRRYRDAA